MNLKKISLAVVLLGLTACSENTGVLSLGPDTYTISVHKAPVLGGGSAAETTALTQANQYCASQGRQFMTAQTDLSSLPVDAQYGPTSYSLTFECLEPGDPRLQSPNLVKAPDVVIENRSD